jgi:hypothetical protein
MGSGTNRKARLERGSRSGRKSGIKSGSLTRKKGLAYLKWRAFRAELRRKAREGRP